MKFESLSASEVQEVYFELKNQVAMKAFFGSHYFTVVEPLLRSGLVKKPTDFLAQMDPISFRALLAEFDGSRNLARYYGVSIAFVRSLWRKLNPVKSLSLTQERLLEGLAKYGSVRMVCRMLQVKESEVRKVAKASNLELAPYLNFEFGNYEVNRGRRAELYWKGQRGANITKDLNESESSQSDYDFDDVELGRVNVKSSKRYRYKAKCRRHSPYCWTFSASGTDKCDHIVFVLYDGAFENPLGWGLVKAEALAQLGKTTFTVRSLGLGTPDNQGQITQFTIE